jgi:hypothetical protein
MEKLRGAFEDPGTVTLEDHFGVIINCEDHVSGKESSCPNTRKRYLPIISCKDDLAGDMKMAISISDFTLLGESSIYAASCYAAVAQERHLPIPQ